MAKLDHNTWDIDDLIENLIGLLSALDGDGIDRHSFVSAKGQRDWARYDDAHEMGNDNGLADRIGLVEQGS
jgi:hypothetical protein